MTVFKNRTGMLAKSLDKTGLDKDALNRQAAGLEAASDLSRETGIAGHGIKPCIAAILDQSFDKTSYPKADYAAVIISSELKRLGKDYGATMERLEQWNQKNCDPLRKCDLERAVNNGFSNDYPFGCTNNTLIKYCVGDDICPFRTKTIVQNGRLLKKDLRFFDYEWQLKLSNRQVLLYCVGIPLLEKRRKVGVGGKVYASHSELAKACGITTKRLGKDLEILAQSGLIEYEKGSPRVWETRASTIRRLFPVPRPESKCDRIVLCDKKEV
jgi:hypothetical protein